MAVMILGLLGVGFYMAQVLTQTDSDTLMLKFDLVQVHKSWGFTVFALALLRVIWRLANPTPALPSEMGRVQRLAAHGGHIALYICLFAMPLTGWLMASASPLQDAYGIKNMVFGLFELPDPFKPGGEELESLFRALHFYTALALTGLLLTHAGAALKHHFLDRDSVLTRMIRG
jgi:cytochrome b561